MHKEIVEDAKKCFIHHQKRNFVANLQTAKNDVFLLKTILNLL